jgi:hypothetical protein
MKPGRANHTFEKKISAGGALKMAQNRDVFRAFWVECDLQSAGPMSNNKRKH